MPEKQISSYVFSGILALKILCHASQQASHYIHVYVSMTGVLSNKLVLRYAQKFFFAELGSLVKQERTRKICDAMHHGSRNVLDYNFKNISVTLTLYHTVEF